METARIQTDQAQNPGELAEVTPIVSQLERTGFTKAATLLKVKEVLWKKAIVAYEHYRYVKPEYIKAFDKRLEQTTHKEDKWAYTYDKLEFIAIKEYAKVPPAEVLDQLATAQQRGCFDAFEVCRIRSVKVVKDPILFGRVNGCPDRFYIAQWDDDVKIEDILEPGQG